MVYQPSSKPFLQNRNSLPNEFHQGIPQHILYKSLSNVDFAITRANLVPHSISRETLLNNFNLNNDLAYPS